MILFQFISELLLFRTSGLNIQTVESNQIHWYMFIWNFKFVINLAVLYSKLIIVGVKANNETLFGVEIGNALVISLFEL